MNHICLGFFLRDFLKKRNLFTIFEDCRRKRNLLVYHGGKMDIKTAEKTIEQIKKLIEELIEIIGNS